MITKEQKKATLLLQSGTFLEYFDLTLYVHMAVILNDLFFPPGDTRSAQLLSAFAFCSAVAFRPIGALIFGYLGDQVGRKSTIVLTMLLMMLSCIVIATLPTYAQIGVAASWIVTLCRIIQGMSSMGEVVGAEIYLTETIKPPLQYPLVSLCSLSATLGGTLALGVGVLATGYGLNWRTAFWVGSVIAVIGSMARTRLRETPEFLEHKHRMTEQRRMMKEHAAYPVEPDTSGGEKVDKKVAASYFAVNCASALFWYFNFVFCAIILQKEFGYTAAQIISHNLVISLLSNIGQIAFTYLSYRIHPLFLNQAQLVVCALCTGYYFLFFDRIDTPFHLGILQAITLSFLMSAMPSSPIFYRHMAIAKRFRCATMNFALSRSLIYIVTSFGSLLLIQWFGYRGILVLLVPATIGFACAIRYMAKLENVTLSFRKIPRAI